MVEQPHWRLPVPHAQLVPAPLLLLKFYPQGKVVGQ